MGTTTYIDTGNVHLDMELEATLPYHEVVASLVIKYSVDSSSDILDIGCGLGHIENEIKNSNPDLRVDIADAYDACLATTASRGNTENKFKIDETKFNILEVIDKKYDTIVMSHVLEHLIFPAKAIDDVLSMLKQDGVLILAVPNPVRPFVFISNLFKYHYVNRGHVYAWDPSHWKNFLEEIMGLEVVEYKSDYIQFPRATRSKILRTIGKVIVKLAPWWGYSNIAVVKVSENTTNSIYNKWKSVS